MAQVHLKEVDGMLMLPLSAEVQAQLSLSAESLVEWDISGAELRVRPQDTDTENGRYRHTEPVAGEGIPTFSVEELLADFEKIPRDPAAEREWLTSPPVGRELI